MKARSFIEITDEDSFKNLINNSKLILEENIVATILGKIQDKKSSNFLKLLLENENFKNFNKWNEQLVSLVLIICDNQKNEILLHLFLGQIKDFNPFKLSNVWNNLTTDDWLYKQTREFLNKDYIPLLEEMMSYIQPKKTPTQTPTIIKKTPKIKLELNKITNENLFKNIKTQLNKLNKEKLEIINRLGKLEFLQNYLNEMLKDPSKKNGIVKLLKNINKKKGKDLCNYLNNLH